MRNNNVVVDIFESEEEHNFVNLKKKLYKYHKEHVYQVDIICLDDNRWFNLWSGELISGRKESFQLPVEGGLWEWEGDWTKLDEVDSEVLKENNKFIYNLVKKVKYIKIWYRTRRNTSSLEATSINTVVYLEEAIKLVTEAEEKYYENDLKLNETIWKLYQNAITLLLDSLRSETDPQNKHITAPYLQRLMQKVEEISEGSGREFSTSALIDLNSSQTNLMTFSHSNSNLTCLPEVTREFPDEANWTNRLSRISKVFRLSSKDSLSHQGDHSDSSDSSTDSNTDISEIKSTVYDCCVDEEDTDSLKNCPVCSDLLTGTNRTDHINICLTNSSNKSVIGDRFTVKILQESDPKNQDKECPICYEEFRVGEGVAVMNCLCQFHEKCIVAWFERDVKRQCPYHCE